VFGDYKITSSHASFAGFTGCPARWAPNRNPAHRAKWCTMPMNCTPVDHERPHGVMQSDIVKTNLTVTKEIRATWTRIVAPNLTLGCLGYSCCKHGCWGLITLPRCLSYGKVLIHTTCKASKRIGRSTHQTRPKQRSTSHIPAYGWGRICGVPCHFRQPKMHLIIFCHHNYL